MKNSYFSKLSTKQILFDLGISKKSTISTSHELLSTYYFYYQCKWLIIFLAVKHTSFCYSKYNNFVPGDLCRHHHTIFYWSICTVAFCMYYARELLHFYVTHGHRSGSSNEINWTFSNCLAKTKLPATMTCRTQDVYIELGDSVDPVCLPRTVHTCI
jgi:hypothetical protein